LSVVKSDLIKELAKNYPNFLKKDFRAKNVIRSLNGFKPALSNGIVKVFAPNLETLFSKLFE